MFDGIGMSFFIVMPGFLSLLGLRNFNVKMMVFLAIILSIATFTLFFHGAGYYQFGPRYTMDYVPYLLIFLAMGLPRLNDITKFLIFLSIGHNTYGAILFPLGVWQTNPPFWSQAFSRTLIAAYGENAVRIFTFIFTSFA
jgi:hypothetical protein